MQVLEIEIATQSYNFCIESDAKRIQYAERALTDAAEEALFNLQSSRQENAEYIKIQDVFTVVKSFEH